MAGTLARQRKELAPVRPGPERLQGPLHRRHRDRHDLHSNPHGRVGGRPGGGRLEDAGQGNRNEGLCGKLDGGGHTRLNILQVRGWHCERRRMPQYASYKEGSSFPDSDLVLPPVPCEVESNLSAVQETGAAPQSVHELASERQAGNALLH